MRNDTLALVGAAMLLSACGGQNAQAPDGETGDGEDAETFVKFHPQENFCVTYEQSGMLSGTSTECMRKWGTERVEIEDFVVGIGGMTQPQKAHKIYIGDKIYNIDTDAMTGTVTTNPLYQNLSQTDPVALGEAMMASWGMVDSGEDKDIAGTQCNVMNSPQMGSVCLTDNLVMLEQTFMGTTKTATAVDLTSGGPDSNYSLFEQVELTEGPDVGAILETL